MAVPLLGVAGGINDKTTMKTRRSAVAQGGTMRRGICNEADGTVAAH